jgi:CysZ protein
MNNPMLGLGYFIDGFRLITKPGLKRFVVIPLAINIILFSALFFLLRYFVGEFNVWFAHHLPAWLHWLTLVFWILFLMSFILLFVFAFVTIANIIAAPFNSFLAEKVELYLTGKLPEQRSLMQNIRDIPRIVSRQLAILGYFLLWAIPFLILFFIPFLQTVAPLLWFLFHAWYLTITYVDYPTDNHRVSLKKVRLWLRQRRSVSLGFGISVLVATMIPVINFFTIPAAVAAATKFWVKENRQEISGRVDNGR